MVGIGGEWWPGRERQCGTKRMSIAALYAVEYGEAVSFRVCLNDNLRMVPDI
jgi:hypothetical protein